MLCIKKMKCFTFSSELHPEIEWMHCPITMFPSFDDGYLMFGHDGSHEALMSTCICALCISVHKVVFLPLSQTTVFSVFEHLMRHAVHDAVVHHFWRLTVR